MTDFLKSNRHHAPSPHPMTIASASGASRAPADPILARFQPLADASPAVQRVQALQRLADTRAEPVQRLEEEELLQGKMMQRVEDEELLQGKAIQRMDEEEPLQGKTMQRQGSAPAPAAQNGLPGQLRQGIESLSGMSMADVRVHRNSEKPAQVGAHAYAQGRDIHLASGQEQHLPHEAWHVVQQAQGRVQPTTQVNGAAVNDDAGLEREADAQGARAAQFVAKAGEGPFRR